MCLGIPGRIIEVWDEDSGARMARAQFPESGSGPDVRRICLACLPELAVGAYVIVHAGFALTEVDEKTAMETIATMTEYGVLGDGVGSTP
jgi:hydrogenase expression/formation protein HypC